MRGTSVITAVLAVAASVSARPMSKRQYSVGDVNVLNYALTLEYLERKFYQEALANYSQAAFVAAGFPDPFYSNLQMIAAEEATHVDFLVTALQAAGATPVQECTYSFGVTDPKSFIILDSVIEGVGSSAYLGAAMDIASAEYLTAAAQILTIESRHTAYVRKELGEAGMPQPFDTPLDLDQVYTLVAPMIVACPPSNPPLPVKAFPSLASATAAPIKSGQVITLTTTATGATYAAFLALLGPTFMPLTPVSGGYTTTIPAGFAGQTYIVLTNQNSAVTDDTTIAGPAIIEIAEVL